MDGYDYWQDVENLLVPHRTKESLRRLMSAGSLATDAVRRGLKHPDSRVRYHCCRILDHFLDEAALPDLIAALEDEDAEVRGAALHALACEKCKEGECRPGEEEVLPIVLRMLREDPEVKREAINLLFQVVHRRQDAAEALEHARDFDPDPRIRKQATLRAPGGVMWMRTSPNPRDRRRLRTSNPRQRLSVK
jgi:hypothetical protein